MSYIIFRSNLKNLVSIHYKFKPQYSMDSTMACAIPFFFLTIGIELLIGYLNKKKYYNFNDAITNLNIGIGSQTVGLLTKILMLGAYFLVYKYFALIHIPIENPYVFGGLWVVTLIVFDCIYYWAHRFGH